MKNCHYYLELIKHLNIPQLHKDVIVGCGLGDARFTLSGKENGIMGFGQGLPNKLYLDYLFDIMKQYATQPVVKEATSFDPRYNKTNIYYAFSTKASPIFFPYAKLFLDITETTRRVVKIIPGCMYELLTPGALAF